MLESLADSGADAFYLGGKGLNMRLHRRDLNLTDGELVTAAELCRARGLGLYVTVNKLMGADDLAAAPEYLDFLAREVRPDALIVQDLAIPALIAERGLDLALHASVMMNAHDEPGLRALAALGFTRVVLSRESSLADVRRLLEATGMEMEYFAHGDMCVAHGSQCLYSGMLFGLSSNRGLCMKPCRWPFSAEAGGRRYGPGFPLAVRDMCLYPELGAALEAGVSSFKIEGRMRPADYVGRVIAAYAEALDRLTGVGDAGSTMVGTDDEAYRDLFEKRMRDFTTAFARGNPGSAMLNARWEGTGKFYSTGKVFSVAAPEPEAGGLDIARIEAILDEASRGAARGTAGDRPTLLSVRVDGAAAASAALNAGADRAILSGDPFGDAAFVSAAELEELRRRFPGKSLALALPRMLDDAEYPAWERAIAEREGLFDTLYLSQLGMDARFKGNYALAGDAPLNVLNAEAAALWAGRGLSSVCASVEAGARDLAALALGSPVPVELVAHGRPCAMYLSLDLAECVATLPEAAAGSAPASPFRDAPLTLFDERGTPRPALRDARGKYQLLPAKALRLLPLVPALSRLGVGMLRIDGALYDDRELASLCAAYRAVLDGADPAAATTLTERYGAWLGAIRTES